MASQSSYLGGAVSHCARCGRELTDPRSVKNGLGPVCIKIVMREQEQANTSIKVALIDSPPLTERLVAKYDGERCLSNVPYVHVDNNSGYAWGYAGSGPSEFALNAIDSVLHRLGWTDEVYANNYMWKDQRARKSKTKPFILSWVIRHEFKDAFIAPADTDKPFDVPFVDVVRWLNQWGVKHASIIPEPFPLPEPTPVPE